MNLKWQTSSTMPNVGRDIWEMSGFSGVPSTQNAMQAWDSSGQNRDVRGKGFFLPLFSSSFFVSFLSSKTHFLLFQSSVFKL